MTPWSTDHKAIARRYLWAGLLCLAGGGLLALLLRWQLAWPGRPVPLLGGLLFPYTGGAIGPADYPKLFTSHGLVMIFFAVTPILVGALGSFLLPLAIGARELAFPRLNAAGFWLFALSAGLMGASFLAPLGTAASGWTGYPPLSTRVGAPGAGQSLVLLALLLNGLSTLLGGVNLLTTVIRRRAPGMGWLRLPATVWGLFLTSALNVAFVPVLGAALLLLLADRHLGTHFFIAGAAAPPGGDPLAYQHLFWLFGHPEVYVLILPAWGIVTDLVSHFSRRPAHWYPGTVGSMVAVAVLSGLVYGHHLFVAGLTPLLGQGFMLLTLAISLPALVLGLNWLQTLAGGRPRLHTPLLFALGSIFVFGVGGFTGLFLGDISLDLYLHDSLFVVGHLHFTLAAATLLAGFGGLYFWFPKLYGRRLDERLGKLHFALTLAGMVLVFGGQLAAGWAGQPRRLYDPYQYAFLEHLRGLNRATTWAALGLFAGQLPLVGNLAWALWRGPPAGANPWEVCTLEWSALPTPVPEHGFLRAPWVLRGPHSYAEGGPGGRDWLGQAEGGG